MKTLANVCTRTLCAKARPTVLSLAVGPMPLFDHVKKSWRLTTMLVWPKNKLISSTIFEASSYFWIQSCTQTCAQVRTTTETCLRNYNRAIKWRHEHAFHQHLTLAWRRVEVSVSVFVFVCVFVCAYCGFCIRKPLSFVRIPQVCLCELFPHERLVSKQTGQRTL